MKEKKLKYVYQKFSRGKFYCQLVGYNLIERIEVCIEVLAGGIIEVNADAVKPHY